MHAPREISCPSGLCRLLLLGTLIALGLALPIIDASAQERVVTLAPINYALASESRFWMRGTSTVNNFRCDAAQVTGSGASVHPAVSSSVPGWRAVQVELSIPVRSFDCGHRQITEDFYHALRADEYAAIRFSADKVHLEARNVAPRATYRLQIRGRLSIAGVERNVTLSVDGFRLGDGRLRAAGSTALRMTDFDIVPPRAFFGLVQAHDRIEVFFDLLAVPTEPSEPRAPPGQPGTTMIPPSPTHNQD